MKAMLLRSILAAGSCALAALPAPAGDVVIESLARNGTLAWSGAATTGVYRVEWAPTAAGPWSSSWQGLTNLPATGAEVAVAVPMFYRVVHTPPPPPIFSNVTAAVALSLITNRASDTNFLVLDVRTAGEFSGRHVRGAINLDFYGPDFANQLAAQDRAKACLVYCASGTRSGKTTEQMKSLGFVEVYNLLGGFGGLRDLPGAAMWLEP